MAMAIFAVLNGMGVVFLLYVLVQLWKEGRSSKNEAVRQYAIESPYPDRTVVVVVTHPISNRAQLGPFEVPLQARGCNMQSKQVYGDRADGIIEIPRKRYSAR